MNDREAHGMNCAYRSDSDELCTCACRYHAAVDTERTMHAAWRKRAEEAEAENAELRARLAGTKMFPLQSSYSKTTPHPTMIPWAVADKAYAVYRGRYGAQQTLERLAERGGFSAGEMDDFYPGWREEVALVTELRAKLAAAEKSRDEQAEAVRVLGAALAACNELRKKERTMTYTTYATKASAFGPLWYAVTNNPTAAAAVKEAGGG